MTPRIDDDVQSTTTSGFDFLMACRASGSTFTRNGRCEAGDLADVAAHLGRIDIDGADDAKPVARGKLASDHRRRSGRGHTGARGSSETSIGSPARILAVMPRGSRHC